MRKRIVETRAGLLSDPPSPQDALPIESIAQVEVSSETEGHPIEGAFSHDQSSEWRAGTPGEQAVRILFDAPERVRQIYLKFVETHRPRTQEFVLTWSSAPESPAHIIVRQQWVFNPAGSTTEEELYRVDLDNVRVLELMIKPDLNDAGAVASLAAWRIFA